MQNPAMKHLAKLGIARETTGRNYGRIRRCEQLLAHLVGRGEATVEIEDDRFWSLAAAFFLNFTNL